MNDQMVVETPLRLIAVVWSAAFVSAWDSISVCSYLSLPPPPTSQSMARMTSVPTTQKEESYLACILRVRRRNLARASFFEFTSLYLIVSLASIKSRISVAWLMVLYSGLIMVIIASASFSLPCLQRISNFLAFIRLDWLEEGISYNAYLQSLLSMQLLIKFSISISVAGGALDCVGATLLEMTEREKRRESSGLLIILNKQDCDFKQCLETASQISQIRMAPASWPLSLSVLLPQQRAERCPYSRSYSFLVKAVTILKVLRTLNTTSPSSLVDASGLVQNPKSLSGSSLSGLGKLTVKSTAVFQFLYYSFTFFSCFLAFYSTVNPRMNVGKAKQQFLPFILPTISISSLSSTATIQTGSRFLDLVVRYALQMPWQIAAMGNATCAISLGSSDLSRILLRFSMMNLSWKRCFTTTIHFFSQLVYFPNSLRKSYNFFCSSYPVCVLCTNLQKLASYSFFNYLLAGGLSELYLWIQNLKMRKKRTYRLGSKSPPRGTISEFLPEGGIKVPSNLLLEMLRMSSMVDIQSVLLCRGGVGPSIGNMSGSFSVLEQQLPPIFITNTCNSNQAFIQFANHHLFAPFCPQHPAICKRMHAKLDELFICRRFLINLLMKHQLKRF